MTIKVFGEPDQKAVDQLENVMRDERAVAGALMADHHLGYSMPIGGVVAYQDAISPTGVGFDIACGNMAVRTKLSIFDLGVSESSSSDGFMVPEYETIKAIMRQIQKNIAFGLGRSNDDRVSHKLFEQEIWKDISIAFGPDLYRKAQDQLGTVGSGNHYVDLLVDTKGRIWVANHFGSRGLGHTIASGFMAKYAGRDFTDRVPETEDAVVFQTTEGLGQFYIEAMQLAGEYAYAGREYVIQQVLDILGTESDYSVHNHHNYAWLENGLWVVRKGATPLLQVPSFIGGSMGDFSVIVKGHTDKVYYGGGGDGIPLVREIGALGSAPHGAGRVMSRTKAAGKMRKMWYCNNRNCDFTPERSTGDHTTYERNCCPKCNLPLRKDRMRDTSDAAIDWDATRDDLRARGIVVLGAGADEAPGVYKDLGTVLSAHPNIEILESLRPIGVVMAGPDERDPYKD